MPMIFGVNTSINNSIHTKSDLHNREMYTMFGLSYEKDWKRD